jgi:DNA-directed RNA polymerase specialized sigma24 family protein
VLRFFDDMSETDIAKALRCSTGTVKSQTSRGLTRLREVLDDEPDEPEPATLPVHERTPL